MEPIFVRIRHTGYTPKVMVGAAISNDNRITLVVIFRILKENVYVRLMNELVFLPILSIFEGAFSNRIISPPYTSAIILLALQGVDVLHWPATSPDLPPIDREWCSSG
ncbi:hypothetical protein AVEN_219062-1 [Araneus ventricosus]|uniref:Uncharacterized protein n=1 Tax=Araneus ventricosus TaxID=182803 RepID=A0A4Y2GCF4_ARAVE|nr:hypothetical protein AVEN_219062-1 [Araneus ventricosus]